MSPLRLPGRHLLERFGLASSHSADDTFKFMSPEAYARHIGEEKRVFHSDLYGPDLTEKTGSGLRYVLDAFQKRVERRAGLNVWDYTVGLVNEMGARNPQAVRILSLGSGPGGAEMALARRFTVDYEMDCVDINEKSLALGQARADEDGLRLRFVQQDLNEVVLPAETYDLVFAHAALHHLVNHEYVAEQVRRAMKHHSQYVVYDVTARNGLRMWDDTREVANPLWAMLPPKYRHDGQDGYPDTLPEGSEIPVGFECIRSQDLYGVLIGYFKVRIEVPGFAFARRFVDKPFDANYDVDHNPFDRAVVDTVLALDEAYSEQLQLRPEAVFLVLEK